MLLVRAERLDQVVLSLVLNQQQPVKVDTKLAPVAVVEVDQFAPAG